MTTQSTNKHPLAEILYAIADWKEIQVRYGQHNDWCEFNGVIYIDNPGIGYRIKPKEKVKKWNWVYKDDEMVMGVTCHKFKDEEEFFEFHGPKYYDFKLIQKIDSTEQEFDE